MNNYFILLNLILICLIGTKKIESKLPFICNAKEAELFKNPKSIYRLLLYEDTIYLVLKFKIIEFKVPNFLKKENNEFFYTINQPYFIDNIEDDDSTRGLVGFVISTSRKKKNLLIEQMHQNPYTYNETEKRTFLLLITLHFARWPGEFGLMKDIYDENKFIKSKYRFNFNVDYFPNIIFDYYNESSLKISLIQQNSSQVKNLKLNYSTRFLLFHAFNTSSNHLIEFDNENMLHFNKLNFKGSNNSLSIIKIINQLNISLNKFFNCHQTFTDLKQLTGIYYDEKMNSFYLFLERYYLLIDYDLIKFKFELNQTKLLFFENAFHLNFSKDDFKNVIFEYSTDNKWIKIAKKQLYLKTFDQLFSLKISRDQNIEIEKKRIKKVHKFIIECKGQLLYIESNRYCFIDKSYYFIDKFNKTRSFKIEELFKSTPITFESYQSIEFIFNYKDNTFVLMTKSNLFIIEYTIVKIDLDDQLIFEYDKSKILRKISNCLLSDEINCKDSDDKSIKIGFIKLNKFIIFLIIITLIIIMLFLSRKSRKRNNLINKNSELLNAVKQPETLYTNKKEDSLSTESISNLSPSAIQLFKHFATKRKSTKPINKPKKKVDPI